MIYPLTFRVAGVPIPKPRARITRRGNFVPVPYTKWRHAIIDEAHAACLAAQDIGNVWRCDAEAYAVRCVFHMADRRRKDVDNLAGSVLDALTLANLWPDDHLVDVCLVSKRFGTGWSGVEVAVLGLRDGWRAASDLADLESGLEFLGEVSA
jgi:Holliday junction resolvase RusA-like endonuclease